MDPRDNLEVLTVDVTATVSIPRITGIQKVVRAIVGENSNLRLLAFERAVGGYQVLDGIPKLVRRNSSGWWQRFQPSVVTLGGRLITSIQVLFEPKSQILELLRGFASFLYSKFFSTERAQKPSVSRRTPLDPERSPSFVWLLDIPRDSDHLDFLLEGVRRGNFLLGVYLYDVIAVTRPEFDSSNFREQSRAHFERYLELVMEASVVVFLSKSTEAEFYELVNSRKWTNSAKTRTLYPPLRPGPLPEPVANNSGPAKTLLCVSPLTKRKNVGVVLEAFSILKEKGGNHRLRLVAPPMLSADPDTGRLLLDLRRRWPKDVEMYHSLTDHELDLLYRSSDLVLYPSLAEGFGLPAIESIEKGVPFLCSKIAVFEELSGYLPIRMVEKDLPAEWAEQIVDAGRGVKIPPVDWAFLPRRDEFVRTLAELSGQLDF